MSSIKSFNIPKKQVWEAWKCVKANRGASGIDQESIEAFEANLKDNLYKIWNRMSSGCYFPPPVKRVFIPKKSGGKRPLGIPTVSDRIAQTVVKLCLEPMVEPHFLPDSYGYRPGKSAKDAIGVTRQRCWKYAWVLEFDIVGLFDNIPHDLLQRAIDKHVSEQWILLYLRRWLTAPVQDETGQLNTRDCGTPQGGCISPLLSNLFLHYAFDVWMNKHHPELPWCRYADDGLVHCRSQQEAERMLTDLSERMKECGLELHPAKTRIVYCSDETRKLEYPVTEFDFLGYTFRRRKAMYKPTGRIFDGFQPGVSKSSLASMRREVKRWQLKSKIHLDLAAIAKWINPVIRGWFSYYGCYYRQAMQGFARYINNRIRIWACEKYSGIGPGIARSQRWLRRVYESNPNLLAHWKMFSVY